MTQVVKTTKIWDHLGKEVRNFLLWLVAGDPSSPSEGAIWWDTVAHRAKVRTNSATKTLAHLDEIQAGTVTSVTATSPILSSGGATPVISANAASAATANYLVQRDGSGRAKIADASADDEIPGWGQVKAQVAGARDPKESVRVATTAAGTLASSFENGDTIDGVTLATGDRILIKDQAAGADNGIYTVNASGAPTRATDADTSAEVTGGMYVWVNEGTTNADTGWLLTTNDPITLGTTALVFTQVSALGQITAGGGIGKTGATLSVAAGTGLSQDADGLSIDTSLTARYKTFTIGDGVATTFALTHSLGRKLVKVAVSDTTDDSEWDVGVTFTSTSVVTLDFGGTVPTTNQFTVLVIG